MALKLTRKILNRNKVELEINSIVELFRQKIQPQSLFLFGSAAQMKMTDQSDFDLLVVCNSDLEIKLGRKVFASHRKHLPQRAFDVIWMTQKDFETKSEMGGVAFIVKNEGRKLL